jgi:hypothetical protein
MSELSQSERPASPISLDDERDGDNGKGSKRRRRFTREEDEKILEGVRRFKDSYVGMDLWQKIADWSKINRTKEQIRNRHSRLRQQKVDPTGALLPKQTVFHHYVGPSKEFATPNKEQPMFTQASQQPQQSSSNFLSTANASISSFTSNNQTSFVPQVNAPVLHQQQQTQLFAALLQQAHNSHFDLDKAVGNHHFDDVDDIIDEPSAKRQKTVHHGGLDMGSNVAFNIGSFSNAAGLQSPSNNVVTPYNPVDSPLVSSFFVSSLNNILTCTTGKRYR